MLSTYIFIIGTVIGSFLNVCIYRLPRGESIATPPSHCPQCEKRLKPWDLIPIISFLIYRGHCRYCGYQISYQYPLIEALTGFIYLLTYWELGVTPEGVIIMGFASALIVIGVIDFEKRIVPDSISLPGMISGLILASIFSHISFLNSVIGLIVGGGLFLLIATLVKGGMGGGDIKLMAFIGSFLGWKGALLTIFISSLMGSIIGIVLIIISDAGRKTAIPYGPFLALGALISALYGNELISLYIQTLMG